MQDVADCILEGWTDGVTPACSGLDVLEMVEDLGYRYEVSVVILVS